MNNTKNNKEYIALIDGILKEKAGTINLPIKRKNGSIMEREVSEEGQKAITHFEVIDDVEQWINRYNNIECNGDKWPNKCHNMNCQGGQWPLLRNVRCSDAQWAPQENISLVKIILETR